MGVPQNIDHQSTGASHNPHDTIYFLFFTFSLVGHVYFLIAWEVGLLNFGIEHGYHITFQLSSY
jgi:hypothetical protein